MLIDPGIYCRTAVRSREPRPAVFLDRDGVLVEETNYLHLVEDIVMIAAAGHAVRRICEAGLAAVVITNQAGVGRGYYPWDAFETVQREIESRLGARLDAVLACGYHPDGDGPLARDHAYRKPNPGMILHAADALNLDLSRSWLIGDKIIDVEAAVRAKLQGAILVRTGYGSEAARDLPSIDPAATWIMASDDVGSAVEAILESRWL